MAQPVYKLFEGKPTAAWYQLSLDERSILRAKVNAISDQVGAKNVVFCNCWSNEEALFFGVQEFPDAEAVQQHMKLLNELDWFHYVDSKSLLGTAWQQT